MKFNHTAHKGMWTWLAENPKMDKDDWPGWEWNGGIYGHVDFYCFACKYAIVKLREEKFPGFYDVDIAEDRCSRCPLIWPNNASYLTDLYCSGHKGLYSLWARDTSLDFRSKIAFQIANLPVKEGVKTE